MEEWRDEWKAFHFQCEVDFIILQKLLDANHVNYDITKQVERGAIHVQWSNKDTIWSAQ